MKHCSSRRTILQLTSVLAALALGIGPLAAQGGPAFVPLLQQRTVRAASEAGSPPMWDSDADQDAASDFGPFFASVGATVDLSSAIVSSSAFQDSTIDAEGIRASGNTGYWVWLWGLGDYGHVLATSELSVTFVLSHPAGYSLQGSLDGYAGFAGLSLQGPQGSIHELNAFFRTVAVGESGTLAAGQYTFRTVARIEDGGLDPIQLEGGARYAVALEIADVGPGAPGGEVPDGHDVAGEPLRLGKLSGGSIRLTWGSSCRAADEDYAVYQGPLADPLDMSPVTCTTAGERSHEFESFLEAAAFLVVPTDGTTEGSYGSSSDGTQRPPGPNACLPQLLGEPVCP